MRKKSLVKIVIQLLAIFLLMRHADIVLSVYTLIGEIFNHENTYDKVLSFYFIFEKILYLAFLFFVIFFSDKLAGFLCKKEKEDEVIIPFKEENIFMLGLILVLGYVFLDSLTDIITESYYYFQNKTSGSYNTYLNFNERNMTTAIVKFILSIILFYTRNKIDTFIKSDIKK